MSSETMTDVTAVRQRVRATMDAHTISLNQLARQVGDMSTATLSQWLNEKYKGDNTRIAERLEMWLRGLEDRIGVRTMQAAAPAFQRTQTSERIWSMMMVAQRAPTMVVAAGVPGVGKTMTAKAYAAENTNVWLATMDPTVVTPAQVLAEIGRSMRIDVGNANTLRDRLGERMEGAQGLLIIDEAQHANPKALDMIRSLHDRYGVGIAFLGNYGLFAATSAPSKTHGFAQFYRRVMQRARFEGPATADVALMLDAWGITDPGQRKFLTQVAGKMWGLSGISNTIAQATALAVGAGEELAEKHLKAAWAGLNHFEG